MTDCIIWIHGDNLSPYAPTLMAFPDAPAIFVFDDELIHQWAISFKRIVFMYECLLELPVVIRRGDVVSEIVDFCHENGATEIVTMDSPSPRFREIVQQLENNSSLIVSIYSEQKFLYSDEKLNLKRFSHFWKQVKNNAMKNSGSM